MSGREHPPASPAPSAPPGAPAPAPAPGPAPISRRPDGMAGGGAPAPEAGGRPAGQDAAPPPGGRAGRNLPAAIGVGAALGAVVLVTLYTAKPVFLAVVVLAVAGGAWELATALRAGGYRVPRPPLLAAAAGLVCAAYVDGVDGLVLAALLATSVVVGWQQLAGRAGAGNTDVGAALLALGYVPFLAGFTALLLVPADGPRRVTAFVATVVASDVGGYAVGVVAGRHPMAPRISPKKSWEGLGGSVAGCALVGGILVDVLLGGAWWQGVVFGLAVVCSATAGDLVESMLKRDLGIKDMGRLLPGHGGLMDRLDSLLPTAPVAWLVLGALIPPGH